MIGGDDAYPQVGKYQRDVDGVSTTLALQLDAKLFSDDLLLLLDLVMAGRHSRSTLEFALANLLDVHSIGTLK